MQREEAVGASLERKSWDQSMEHLEFESGVGFSFQAVSPRPFWKLYPLSTNKQQQQKKAEKASTKAMYLNMWQSTETILGINYDELHWILFFFCLFAISWATPAAYGVSQARSLIGAAATGLHQSHSNARSEPRLQPTPQLMATLDP